MEFWDDGNSYSIFRPVWITTVIADYQLPYEPIKVNPSITGELIINPFINPMTAQLIQGIDLLWDML